VLYVHLRPQRPNKESNDCCNNPQVRVIACDEHRKPKEEPWIDCQAVSWMERWKRKGLTNVHRKYGCQSAMVGNPEQRVTIAVYVMW